MYLSCPKISDLVVFSVAIDGMIFQRCILICPYFSSIRMGNYDHLVSREPIYHPTHVLLPPTALCTHISVMMKVVDMEYYYYRPTNTLKVSKVPDVS